MNPGVVRLITKAAKKGGRKVLNFIDEYRYHQKYNKHDNISFRPRSKADLKKSDLQAKKWLTETTPKRNVGRDYTDPTKMGQIEDLRKGDRKVKFNFSKKGKKWSVVK
jgi:hypothetical protein